MDSQHEHLMISPEDEATLAALAAELRAAGSEAETLEIFGRVDEWISRILGVRV